MSVDKSTSATISPPGDKSASSTPGAESSASSDVASKTFLTTRQSTSRPTTTQAVTTFDFSVKITIGGKPFSITLRRPRVKKDEEYSDPKYVQEPTSYSGVGPIAKLPGGKKFLSGWAKTGHWFRNNSATQKTYNATNKRFGFAYDYHQISEDEEEKISLEMDKAWEKYSKEYKEKNDEEINIDDVLGIRLELNTKDEKPDFDKPFYFYVIVKKKDKDGNILKDKKGDFQFKIIKLSTGKVSKDDVLGLVAMAIDLSVPRNTYKTFEAYFDARARGFEDSAQVNSVEDPSEDENSIDPNICYLHSILNFVKGLKSKDEQAEEFKKSKADMDREAMDLKRKMNVQGSREEDAHDILMKSNLIGNDDRFLAKRTNYYQKNKLIPVSSPIGDPKDESASISSIAITKGENLQESLDKYHKNADENSFGKWKDDKGIEHQITKSELKYEKKPPYLMLHAKRFDSSLNKIDTPIATPDNLELRAGQHITKGALEGKESIEYPLKGFIYHEGDTISSGHYITYMEDPDGKWRKYDNLNSDRYGKEVVASDEEFGNRKKKAYLYLYKDDENRVLSSLDENQSIFAKPFNYLKSAFSKSKDDATIKPLTPKEAVASQETTDEFFAL